MLSAMFKPLLRYASGLCLLFEQSLLALGAERRCARRLDAISERLLRLGCKINVMRMCIEESRVSEPVDTDLSFREALRLLKQDIREIRCHLASLPRIALAARLQRAFLRLNTIAEETYASADKLQWEIDEHDQRYLP